MRKTDKEIVNNDVMKRIIEMMDKRGVSQNKLMNEIGVAYTVFSKWKYDNGKSYMKYIDEIARCLDVPSDYLVYGSLESMNREFSSQEIEMLDKIKQLGEDEKVLINQLLDKLICINQRLENIG